MDEGVLEDWLKARARATPGKAALYWNDRTYTFNDLVEKVEVLAGQLVSAGVERGTVVGIFLANRPDYLHLCFAIMRLGAIMLPLNTRLTEQEVGFQLEQAKANLLLKEEGTLPKLETSIPCYTLEQASALPFTPISKRDLNLNDLFCLIFTSGTTGKPKAVKLSLENFLHSAQASAYRLGINPRDNWLCTLPLYHVGGLSILLRSCLYGTAVTLHSGFDVKAVKEVLESGKITLVSLVPTQLYRLLESDFKPHLNLRLILLGGAAASEELLAEARARQLPVATTYGLSEACSQVATALPRLTFAKPGTVGKPLLFNEVKVLDDADKPVPAGTLGNIWIRGPVLMQGYLGQKDISENYLFNTGDLGYFDNEDDLFIKQRRSDLIISGGENVYAAEVESVLRKHDDVAEVAVLGLPDPEWGQRVAAAVVLKNSNEVTQADLEQLCLTHLAPYKRPRAYRFVDALPLTPSGKVKKFELLPLFDVEKG